MDLKKTIQLKKSIGFIIFLLSIVNSISAQESSVSYYVDSTFDADDYVRGYGSVIGVYDVGDGSLICYGLMNPSPVWNTTDDRGFAHLYSDGSEAPWLEAESQSVQYLTDHEGGYIFVSNTHGIAKVTYEGEFWFLAYNGERWGDYFQGVWSEPNPYNVQNVWSLYVQEDQKVLIGGAIATDTLQPYLYRALTRLNANGSHDAGFPIIEAIPNNPNVTIYRIHKDSQDRWYLTGNFQGINGHLTNHIARLNSDFSVDTSFVSPFQFTTFAAIEPHIFLVDSQDRIWVSGYKMVVAATQDSLSVARLLPDASFDESFYPEQLKALYPDTFGYRQEFVFGGREIENNHYMLYGTFTHFNDTVQNCITVVDDNGYIQYNYFQGSRVLRNNHGYNPNGSPGRPAILGVTELGDGSLILGGLFSEFDGVTRYNVVKLNRGTVGINGKDRIDKFLEIFPNPASNQLNIYFPTRGSGQVSIFDLSGKMLLNEIYFGDQIQVDVSDFPSGMYLIRVADDEKVAVKKFVVE